MKKTRGRSKKYYLNILVWLIFFVFIVILIAFLISLLSGRTETISLDYAENSTSSVSCVADDLSESFFDISGADNTVQEIKAGFTNDKIDTIMYTLKADYTDSEVARVTDADFRTHYNHYAEEYGINANIVSSTFSLSDLTIRVKLYAEKKALNGAVNNLFMLGANSYSAESLQHYYEDKGFKCNYKE